MALSRVGWLSFALLGRAQGLLRTAPIASRAHLSRARALASAASAAPSLRNPLLEQSHLPLFSSIGAEHVEPAITELLGEFTSGLRELEADCELALRSDAPGRVTWASVVERLESVRARLEYAWGVVGHLTGVKSSDALRDAHAKMQPLVVQAMSSSQQSRPVCDAYRRLLADSDAAVTAGGAPTLDAAQRRIVQSALDEMELSGVALEGEAQARFNEIKLELAGLSTGFADAVLDATKAWNLRLTDKTQVTGFPPSLRAMTAAAAAAAGDESATADAGP